MVKMRQFICPTNMRESLRAWDFPTIFNFTQTKLIFTWNCQLINYKLYRGWWWQNITFDPYDSFNDNCLYVSCSIALCIITNSRLPIDCKLKVQITFNNAVVCLISTRSFHHDRVKLTYSNASWALMIITGNDLCSVIMLAAATLYQ